MFVLLLLLALKAALWIGARALLPLLFFQARHASLDPPPHPTDTDTTSLPAPATSTSSSFNSLHDDGGYNNHNNDNDPYGASSSSSYAPFLAAAKKRRPRNLVQLRASLLAPLRLTHDGGIHLHNFAAFLFSLAFQETATLYLAVLLEAAGFDTSPNSVLRAAFRASVLVVIQLAVLFIPLGICLLFTYRSGSSTPLARRLIYLSLPLVPWLILFFSVPLPSALSSRSGILDSLLARTAVIGVSLIALLSGSAAMAAAWDAVEQWRGKTIRPPNASEIRLAHDAFDRTRSDLESKQTELQRLEREVEISRNEGGGRGWSISNLWNGDARSREIKTLKNEIFGLNAIASAMRDDLETMSELEKRERRSRTLAGKALTAVGWGWSVYCAFRILLSLLNLLLLGYKDTVPPDFISLGLATFLSAFDVDIDVAAWTRQFSLVFVGIVIWARIGSVLGYLGKAFRAASSAASSKRGTETCFLVLFLSEIMVIYLLATLIQLRTSLPPSLSVPSPSSSSSSSSAPPGSTSPPPSSSSSTTAPPPPPLLATLPPFQIVFGSLFDSVFLLSSLATGVYLYFRDTQRSNVGGGGALFGVHVRE